MYKRLISTCPVASELTSENEEEEDVVVEKGDEKLRCVSAMYPSEYLCRQAMSIH